MVVVCRCPCGARSTGRWRRSIFRLSSAGLGPAVCGHAATDPISRRRCNERRIHAVRTPNRSAMSTRRPTLRSRAATTRLRKSIECGLMPIPLPAFMQETHRHRPLHKHRLCSTAVARRAGSLTETRESGRLNPYSGVVVRLDTGHWRNVGPRDAPPIDIVTDAMDGDAR